MCVDHRGLNFIAPGGPEARAAESVPFLPRTLVRLMRPPPDVLASFMIRIIPTQIIRHFLVMRCGAQFGGGCPRPTGRVILNTLRYSMVIGPKRRSGKSPRMEWEVGLRQPILSAG